MNAVKLKINDVGLKLLSLSIEHRPLNVVFIDVDALQNKAVSCLWCVRW